MNIDATETTAVKGAQWVIKASDAFATFIPEDFDEEQKMVMAICTQFIDTEIAPIVNRIESLEPGLMQLLLEKAGHLGLLATSLPEEYGGSGKDFITSTIVNEGLGSGHSFSVTIAAHTGIGSLPILYFGTEEQKQKYIPKLGTGEWKGAYALTEPSSGSDALSIKTTATLSDDGKYYLLNGQKCWITNGGFADIFTIFAKIDGSKFTCFIVERGFDGFTQGAEEHKMGIKGSSTVQLFFQDCKVPVANLLGEVGRGHVIAFNILNIGRLKLCAAALGSAKSTITNMVQYSITREQFGKSIAHFGAIKQKLAQTAIRTWVTESGLYRTAQWIETKKGELLSGGELFSKALLGAAEEFAIECAILKVYGSEMLDYVVDEAVQVHGGNGYSDEYIVSEVYRDSRINRIFEGTNEINRLLIVSMLMKRATKGDLNLMEAAMAVSKELLSLPEFAIESNKLFVKERKYIANFKKAILLCAGASVQKLSAKLESEQEILMNIADMLIETYHAESALLRVMKLTEKKGEQECTLLIDIARTYLHDTSDILYKRGKDILYAFSEGDDLRVMLSGLTRFVKVTPFNSKDARRRIADKMIADKKYDF